MLGRHIEGVPEARVVPMMKRETKKKQTTAQMARRQVLSATRNKMLLLLLLLLLMHIVALELRDTIGGDDSPAVKKRSSI